MDKLFFPYLLNGYNVLGGGGGRAASFSPMLIVALWLFFK